MNDKQEAQYKYDVALSFAGEQREYVEKVADVLKYKGIKVYYDRYDEIDSWGEDLMARFDSVFSDKARYNVMFISREYKEKTWTDYERQIILARQLVEKHVLLPVRFDSTKIPGLIATTSYLNLQNITPKELAEKIIKKLAKPVAVSTSSPKVEFRKPKTIKQFNPYEIREKWIFDICSELKERSNSDSDMDIHVDLYTDPIQIRVIYKNDTVYSLNINKSSQLGNDSGISFYGIPGEFSGTSKGTSNAWGEFKWNKDLESVVLEFFDMSLFKVTSTETKNYTQKQFINELWDVIVEEIERKY